jgi:co-chaperonin GroES (HSP10)
MKLQGTVILVAPDQNPEITEKGIHIPSSVKEKPNTGTILEVGAGCKQARVGDTVHYNRKGANVQEVNGVEYHFINEGQGLFIARDVIKQH